MHKPSVDSSELSASQRAIERIHEAPVDARERLTVAQKAIERIAEKPPTPADLERALLKFQSEFARVRAAAKSGDSAASAQLDRMNRFFAEELAPHLMPEKTSRGRRTRGSVQPELRA